MLVWRLQCHREWHKRKVVKGPCAPTGGESAFSPLGCAVPQTSVDQAEAPRPVASRGYSSLLRRIYLSIDYWNGRLRTRGVGFSHPRSHLTKPLCDATHSRADRVSRHKVCHRGEAIMRLPRLRVRTYMLLVGVVALLVWIAMTGRRWYDYSLRKDLQHSRAPL